MYQREIIIFVGNRNGFAFFFIGVIFLKDSISMILEQTLSICVFLVASSATLVILYIFWLAVNKEYCSFDLVSIIVSYSKSSIENAYLTETLSLILSSMNRFRYYNSSSGESAYNIRLCILNLTLFAKRFQQYCSHSSSVFYILSESPDRILTSPILICFSSSPIQFRIKRRSSV